MRAEIEPARSIPANLNQSAGTTFNGGILSLNAQEVYDSLSRLGLEELQELRLQTGRNVHTRFLYQGDPNFTGIVLAEKASAGLVADALASNDGSSRYLRAAVLPFSAASSSAFGVSDSKNSDLDSRVRQFVESRQLRGNLLLTSEAEPAQLNIRCAGKLIAVNTQPAGESAAGLAIEREKAAIVALAVLGQERAEPTQNPAVAKSAVELLPAIRELRTINRQVAELIVDQIFKLDAPPGLSIGESFTMGKLASLFSAHQQSARFLQLVYGWYDPGYKAAMGVPAENLTDDLIATNDTMIKGACGLLANGYGKAQLALGTSGWANFWKPGEADNFSIGLANLQPGADPAKLQASALQFRVLSSVTSPISPERRELTRQLGVTAALHMLAAGLGLNFNTADRAALSEVVQSTAHKLKEHTDFRSVKV